MTEERLSLVIKTLFAEKKGLTQLLEEDVEELQNCIYNRITDYGRKIIEYYYNDMDTVQLCEKDIYQCKEIIQKKYSINEKGERKGHMDMFLWMTELYDSMNLLRPISFHQELICHLVKVKRSIRENAVFESMKQDNTIMDVGKYYNCYDERITDPEKDKKCMEMQNNFVLKNYEECVQMCNEWKDQNLNDASLETEEMPDIIQWIYER